MPTRYNEILKWLTFFMIIMIITIYGPTGSVIGQITMNEYLM